MCSRAFWAAPATGPANRPAAVAHLATTFNLEAPLANRTFEALADPAEGLFRDARIDAAGMETVLALRMDAGLLGAQRPDASRYYDGRYLEN